MQVEGFRARFLLGKETHVKSGGNTRQSLD